MCPNVAELVSRSTGPKDPIPTASSCPARLEKFDALATVISGVEVGKLAVFEVVRSGADAANKLGATRFNAAEHALEYMSAAIDAPRRGATVMERALRFQLAHLLPNRTRPEVDLRVLDRKPNHFNTLQIARANPRFFRQLQRVVAADEGRTAALRMRIVAHHRHADRIHADCIASRR